MRMGKVMLLFSVIGVILTLASMVHFETESVPDLKVVKYGFPFYWIHHQTVSIAGPVDIWSFQWLSLVIDFVFWFIISVIIVFSIEKYRKEPSYKK